MADGVRIVPDLPSYLIALANLEKTWWNQHGKDHFDRNPGPGSPELAITLLDQIIASAPYLVPDKEDLNKIILWHTDLHFGNIMISPTGPAHITGIIDWQNLSTGPYFSKACLASCMLFRGEFVQSQPLIWWPQLPDNFDDLSPERQKDARIQVWHGQRLKRYEAKVYKQNEGLRLNAMITAELDLVESLLLHIPLASHYGGLISLRESVRRIWSQWTRISPPGTPCPINFTEDEIKDHEEAMVRVTRYDEACEALRFRVSCYPDGNVPKEDLETATEKRQTEEDKWDHDLGPFPYRNGAVLYTM